MPLLRRWEYKGAICGIWKVTETQEWFSGKLSDLPYLEAELASYKADSRKMEYLAVRMLLKEIATDNMRILHYKSGKPYIEGNSLKISISHTKGYVAVCLHPHNEVGIDIEYISPRVKKISSRFVREDEMSFIKDYSCIDGDGCRYVYNLLLLWSAKETIYKIIDQPEVDFTNHMRIYPFVLGMSVEKQQSDMGFIGCGSIESQEYKTEMKSLFSVEYLVHEDFVCTCCISDQPLFM